MFSISILNANKNINKIIDFYHNYFIKQFTNRGF